MRVGVPHSDHVHHQVKRLIIPHLFTSSTTSCEILMLARHFHPGDKGHPLHAVLKIQEHSEPAASAECIDGSAQ